MPRWWARTLVRSQPREACRQWSGHRAAARRRADRAGGGRMRGFSMSEADMEAFAARPWVATASDAGIALPEDGPSTHARYYGTFPRKIRHYALDRGVISVEDAIRSMTSLAGADHGHQGSRRAPRGKLRRTSWCSTSARIRDEATFFSRISTRRGRFRSGERGIRRRRREADGQARGEGAYEVGGWAVGG